MSNLCPPCKVDPGGAFVSKLSTVLFLTNINTKTSSIAKRSNSMFAYLWVIRFLMITLMCVGGGLLNIYVYWIGSIRKEGRDDPKP